MPNTTLKKSTLNFLQQLSKNNNREWFNQHKGEYIQAKEIVEQFLDELIAKMNTHDEIETHSGKKCLYAVYKDVRFAKDKVPYNPFFSGYLRRAKPMLRGGYFIWIGPGSSRVACGFSYPNPADLKRIRLDINDNYAEWNKLLSLKSIRTNFGKMQGAQVKTSPRVFSSDHAAIELLRFKQYWFEHLFSDQEVLATDFLAIVNNKFKSIRPFFDYMSEVLTTDLNGELIGF